MTKFKLGDIVIVYLNNQKVYGKIISESLSIRFLMPPTENPYFHKTPTHRTFEDCYVVRLFQSKFSSYNMNEVYLRENIIKVDLNDTKCLEEFRAYITNLIDSMRNLINDAGTEKRLLESILYEIKTGM